MIYKIYSSLLFVVILYPLQCQACEDRNYISNCRNCTSLRDEFSKAASQFTSCSVNYSTPIHLCEYCVDFYIDVITSYQNMAEVIFNGTKCIDCFINLDRLQIVETQYASSVNLWTRAKCYECYVINENGTQTNNTTVETRQFTDYYNIFMNCVNNTNETTLCKHCMRDYTILNDYYKSISNNNERIGLCIDLEDLMNRTWSNWSYNCCKYRRHNEYAFIGSTVGVLLFTALFYIVVQFYSEKGAPTIIQQSRFAESVNGPIN